MIILEGPDGAGKTTLLKRLHELFPTIEVHERASDSVDGPVKDVHQWAQADLDSWAVQPLSFYDRHPMISEPIYGQILRGGCDEWFSSSEAQTLGTKMVVTGLIIVCLPDVEIARLNIIKDGQMDGVVDQYDTIHEAYHTTLMGLAAFSPSSIVHYDYTKGESEEEDVISLVEAYMTRWTRKQNGRIA